jgi:hypothetical protein
MLTLFAGFVLSFSKIFCDWDLEASAAIFAVLREIKNLEYFGGGGGRGDEWQFSF